MRSRKVVAHLLCGLLALSFVSPPLLAAGAVTQGKGDAVLSLAVEHFRWQEFTANGQRLLTEQGPRAAVLLSYDAADRLPFRYILRLRGKAYAGLVDYNGQDGSGNFVASDTTYRGVQGELQLGLRQRLSASRSLALMTAVGADVWSRRIADSRNALAQPVSGFQEDYRLSFARLGLAFERRQGRYLSSVELGLRRSLSVDEDITVNGQDLRLHPGRDWSAYAGVLFRFGRRQLAIQYEGLRFDASAPVLTSGSISVWQPRSEADIVTLSFGYLF